MKKPRNLTGKGYYQLAGSEPMAKKPIALRLPESVDRQARELAGDDLVNFVRQAVAEKVARECQQQEAS